MSKEDNDNYNEEEYHFAVEPESSEGNFTEEEPSLDPSSASSATAEEKPAGGKFDVEKIKELLNPEKIKQYITENAQVRNALIAVVGILVLIIIYNFTSSMLAKKKSKSNTTTQVTQQKTQQKQAVQQVQPMQTQNFNMEQENIEKENKTMQRNLSRIKESQDSINSRVSSLSNDTFKLNTEYQEINEKINRLADQVEKLASAVEDQSHTIMVMIEKHRRQQRTHVNHPIRQKTYMKYNVQAVIPGRAWLIGQNGSTLTVRKGSIIPGYGVVTLIDVSQGRVMTNSGKIIAFAQTDS